MKRSTIEILRCPLCKGKLKLQIKKEDEKEIIEGSLICINSKKKYSIIDSIPRLYISNDDIFAHSNNFNFSDFILTSENLDMWIKKSKIKFKSKFFLSKNLTIFLVVFGWISFFSSISLLSLSYFIFDIAMIYNISVFIFLLICSSIFFLIDYIRYRIGAKIEYSINLRTLKKLYYSSCEDDIHNNACIRARKRESSNSFVPYKAKIITSILNNIKTEAKTALNVGCGGALHKLASKPYFDKGYDMIGVDINEEYLKEFTQIFKTDGILANGLALPFNNNNFDLINFTEILEHFHHPLLGLREAHRVLKADGIIILNTNNRCGITFRCSNPLVFAEKIISLHYDNILPPRKILGKWMNLNFYHTEFSKNEITKFMKVSGFDILSFETIFNMQSRDILTKIFKKIPSLRFLCTYFQIIGKKKLIVV